MFIKQIIIQGFKSYKNQTIVEPFSPKHNVIVGRNGSGKSNFFAAIRFVLSDAYTQLGREERSALLHEGSGSVMSAYVEIIFDNSDDRFPTGKDELVLRRTIGQKKDEYTLDRKNATKADVMNLLETAGFSRSNPYYIVPQGRVTRLTNMKDAERLDLLKSVAGTGVYDQRKEESQKIMNETNNKLASIDVTFDQIRERLSELEEEQQELRSFQEKDQERRGLQYNLFHREQEMLSQALSDIEEKRETGIEDADEHRMRAATCDEELATINEKMAELKQQIEFARVDRKALEDERREAAKAQAQVELEVKNMTDGQSAAQKAKHTHDAELQRVRTTLKQRETELGQIMPRYNKLKQAEEATKAKLDEAQTARQRLYAKQGRSAAYKTKKDRDTWLDGQINDTYQHLSTMKAVRVQTAEEVKEVEIEVKEVEIEVKDLEPEIQKLQDQIDGHGTSLEEINQQILKEKEDRDNLMDQRKEFWRQEAKLDSTVSTSRTDLDRAERNLSHMMDGNTFRGIQSVRRIAEKHNLDGCYGTLAELIEVPTHKTAVEVTAGNSLFHYVVDSDDTATRVMEILNKERAGRVTFMPLNRLKPKVPKFPNAQDARPLMSLIQYDEKYEKAVQQVFGKSIICQNLTVAGQYARTHGVNAVTPEGDRSDKKGALTGGYHDPRSSRLAATKALVDSRQAFDTARARGTELRRKLDKLDQTITGKVGEIQKLEQRKNHAQNRYGLLRQELKTKVDLLRNKKESLDAKQRQEAELAAKVKALSDQQNAYEAEKATEFKKALTATEESQLENLAKTVKDLQQQYSKVASERSEVETRKALIEVELKDNLQPMLEQLEASELENAESGGSADIKALQLQLKRHNKTLQTLKQKLSASEEQIETWTTNVASLEAQSAEMRKEQEELTKQIERHQRRLEKSMQKKAALQNRRQETIESIRELGAVSDDAKKRFEKWNSEKIVKQLHKVNEALKKYNSVNKHAFEHYRKSTKQREALEERRKELEDSKKSIEELIEVLDQRKDEAIERTFRQVSREFTNVFAKLVPAGKGRLIIQRKADKSNQNGEEVDSDEEQARRSSVENYIGVGISVSFNSKHDDQQRIQQLSGGQKSLCALTLIFAIQACDPAPFYLFDEIDANLDAQYRTAVAEHLHKLSSAIDKNLSGQFICTTFRPEMLRVAEKCYGVTFANSVSSIRAVPVEEALEFVEGQTQGHHQFHLSALLAASHLSDPTSKSSAYTGPDFLCSYIIGCEVGPRIGLSLGGADLLSRGWHSGTLMGPAAVAAALSSLFHLTESQTQDALGTASTQAGELMAAQFGSMAKRMQHGFAARNGFLAAVLARGGYTGIQDVFDVPYGGFLSCFSQGSEWPGGKVDEITKGLGTRWEVMNISVKFHACMAALYGTVDCISSLQRAHPERFKNVNTFNSIESHVSKAAFEHGGWITPAGERLTSVAAQMSIQYAAAAQVVDGEVMMPQFSEEKLNRKEVVELMRKVTPILDKSLVGESGWATKVIITFDDGMGLTERVVAPHFVKPGLSKAEVGWRTGDGK